MKKILKIFFLVIVLYLTVFLVINPQPCLAAAKSALGLCLDTVIPTLFPFFVCSGLLTALGFSNLCSRFLSPLMRPLFNLPGSGALTFFLGILSGYPVGATTAVNLYSSGQCTKTEAERMLAFCNNSGPVFVIGVVGTAYLGCPAAGRYLYISHIVAAIIVGVVFRFYKGANQTNRTLPPSPDVTKNAALLSLGGIIDSSVFSILKVCGFVIFFSVFTSTLPQNPIIYSFAEIVGGIKKLSQINSRYMLPLISFFLSFSGLSVMFQVSSIISPYGLSIIPYIGGKLLQGIFSFVITCILQNLFPVIIETFAPSTEFISPYSPVSLVFSSVVISILAALALLCIMIPIASSTKKRL